MFLSYVILTVMSYSTYMAMKVRYYKCTNFNFFITNVYLVIYGLQFSIEITLKYISVTRNACQYIQQNSLTIFQRQ